MSSRVSRRALPPNRYERESRQERMPLRLDLNASPPSESRDQEGTSSPNGPQAQNSAPPALIDVDAVIDDDVLISSPRAFAEAKSKASRSRALVHDIDSGEQTTGAFNNRNKRRRVPANQTIINCDLYINLEGSGNSMRQDVMTSHIKPQPPPPPNIPTFSCPICMGQLVEEMSTKCGHIFCKKCIKAAIAAQSKCPTCRKKITMKDTIRVYLPTSN